MSKRAEGTFEVTLTPTEHDQVGVGQMALTKRWSGALSATGAGTMLSAGDPSTGRAGYVAIETVDGTLEGRSGGFVCQQFGIMRDPEQELRYEIVPGSGTDELEGIEGTLRVEISEGEHRYVLDYDLP